MTYYELINLILYKLSIQWHCKLSQGQGQRKSPLSTIQWGVVILFDSYLGHDYETMNLYWSIYVIIYLNQLTCPCDQDN